MLTEKNIPLLASVLEEELFLVPDVAATKTEVRVFQLLLGQGIIVNKIIKQFGSASITEPVRFGSSIRFGFVKQCLVQFNLIQLSLVTRPKIETVSFVKPFNQSDLSLTKNTEI